MSVFFVSVCPIGSDGSAAAAAASADVASGGTVLLINMQNVAGSEGAPGPAGQSHLRVTMQCENMELVAELVQDLAAHFKLEELQSECDFPDELAAFEEVSVCVARSVGC